VKDDKHAGAVNRISYEWCVLTTLREKLRCKELWVKGAHRFCNPDERQTPPKPHSAGESDRFEPCLGLLGQIGSGSKSFFHLLA
jgi:hypothetical protein